jgi:hypothetical protein
MPPEKQDAIITEFFEPFPNGSHVAKRMCIANSVPWLTAKELGNYQDTVKIVF